MSTSPQLDLDAVVSSGPYPMAAFNFVREGLSYTSKRVHGDLDPAKDLDRHVSGQELCLGLRDFAIRKYGYLAPVVFDHWNVRRTDDFGRIVFALIDRGFMSKTDEDTLDDFRGVYDFAEAFSDEQLLEDVARS